MIILEFKLIVFLLICPNKSSAVITLVAGQVKEDLSDMLSIHSEAQSPCYGWASNLPSVGNFWLAHMFIYGALYFKNCFHFHHLNIVKL